MRVSHTSSPVFRWRRLACGRVVSKCEARTDLIRTYGEVKRVILNRNECCRWEIPITEHQASGNQGPGTQSKSSEALFMLVFGFNGTSRVTPHVVRDALPFVLSITEALTRKREIGVTALFASPSIGWNPASNSEARTWFRGGGHLFPLKDLS